ncbi:MAG: oxidoreductase [Candidatus Krumholzibacteria bacterium]|nr:oxidoreductase [Candidatus Krumholzibacteria bacterium]
MKLKIGIYWGAACGGCDIAILDTHEKILEIADNMEIYLWPIAMDFKYDDVRKMDDGYLDVSLYSGAIRNSENEEIAGLLRQKSKTMIALGACAHLGGIPGLANMYTREDILKRVYIESESTINEEGIFPQEAWKGENGELELPRFYNTVKTLDQVVDVEYYIPGCPPVPLQIYSALSLIWDGMLPPKGSVIGASDRSLCDECSRKKGEKTISEIKRPHEIIPDPETCFLEQGLICLGPVTRSGCGSRCIKSGAPCRGCYGPLDDVADQGIKMLSALASILEPKEEKEIDAILDTVPDPLRTIHRFSLAASILRRKKV